MTNSINYPQKQYPTNYSGVTINITNPMVSTAPISCPEATQSNTPQVVSISTRETIPNSQDNNNYNNIQPTQAYPAQYYLNNYNYPTEGSFIKTETKSANSNGHETPRTNPEHSLSETTMPQANIQEVQPEPINLDTSGTIIQNLNSRFEEELKKEQETPKTKVIALTNEYIMSLENYLNNPEMSVRLMAAKEILTRLDEDKSRFDDVALNALLNKMLQDPEKLIRIAALSAFSSGLACGNDYTVKLLNNIQNNPKSDKEDVLEAASILLRMSSNTELINNPDSNTKASNQQQ